MFKFFKNKLFNLCLLFIISIPLYAKDYIINTQQELNSILEKINNNSINDDYINLKVNSIVQPNTDRSLKTNAYDISFDGKSLEQLNIPFINIISIKNKNPFNITNLNINNNKYSIIKVNGVTFSKNINLNLVNKDMVIFINNDIKNASGKFYINSDAISFFNNLVESSALNMEYLYKDILILNENDFINNNSTNSLLNIKNKVNIDNIAAIGFNNFLYNTGNLLKTNVKSLLLTANTEDKTKKTSSVITEQKNIFADIIYAFNDRLSVNTDNLIYKYNSSIKSQNVLDLSEEQIQEINKQLEQLQVDNKNINSKSINQLLGGRRSGGGLLGGGLLGGGLFGGGNRRDGGGLSDLGGGLAGGGGRNTPIANLISGIFTALNPFTYIRPLVDTTTNLVTNLVKFTINSISAAVKIFMIPVQSITSAFNFVTDYNDYINDIPTFSSDISGSTRITNTVNNSLVYHFQDTRVGNFATDWLISFKIKNTSNHDIFFNTMLISEYAGEGISKPIGTNTDQRMFAQANQSLAIILNQMYNNPNMSQYLKDTPNIVRFISDNLEGINVQVTQPEQKPTVAEILNGLMSGVNFGGNNNNAENNAETGDEEQPFIQTTRLTSNKSTYQQINPVQQDEVSGIGNINFISTDNLIYTGSDANNGNFLISAVNCQDPYYVSVNGQQGNILDLLPTMTANVNIPAGKICEIQAMFKPKTAGYHKVVVEIGSATLPTQNEQFLNIVLNSIDDMTGNDRRHLDDIRFYAGLNKIILEMDGWAYNEKNMLVDLNNDYELDTFQTRIFDGQITNPFSGSQLTSTIDLQKMYTDKIKDLIMPLNVVIDPAQVFDPNISILTDFDYWFMRQYFVDKYNNDNSKFRKFPLEFRPYYRILTNISNIKSLYNLKLSNVVSVDFKKPIRIFMENASTGQFIEITPNVNIYTTDMASSVRPKGTGFDFFIEDGGIMDRDGITNGQIGLNPLWIGVKDKTLKLGEGMLAKPDMDNLVHEEDNITWGGLPVH